VLGCGPEMSSLLFLHISSLPVVERLPGWRGRYFHSPSMTFAHYEFARGRLSTSISILRKKSMKCSKELEVTIDRGAQIARAGVVAIVPAGIRHSVKALTDGRAIIVDFPVRPEFK
jgi:hypothetical protein